MGDGVNIAARLEGIAKPGAICLSEQAYWEVKARLDIAVVDLAATRLKNIGEPVRAFSLQVGLPTQAKPATGEKSAPQPPFIPFLILVFIILVVDSAESSVFLAYPAESHKPIVAPLVSVANLTHNIHYPALGLELPHRYALAWNRRRQVYCVLYGSATRLASGQLLICEQQISAKVGVIWRDSWQADFTTKYAIARANDCGHRPADIYDGQSAADFRTMRELPIGMPRKSSIMVTWRTISLGRWVAKNCRRPIACCFC